MEEPNIFIQLPETSTKTLADPSMVLYWKNLENRTLWIDGEIDNEDMEIIDYILLFNREDRGIAAEDREPIRILINSPGGCLDIAESVIAMMKLSETPIYTYAMGTVASAASLIYLAGHRKFALPSATWIFHKGSATMSGDYDAMMRAVEDYQKTVEKMVKFYIERTNISEEVVREKIKQDWYLYATDENIILDGICDVILTSIDEII